MSFGYCGIRNMRTIPAPGQKELPFDSTPKLPNEVYREIEKAKVAIHVREFYAMSDGDQRRLEIWGV